MAADQKKEMLTLFLHNCIRHIQNSTFETAWRSTIINTWWLESTIGVTLEGVVGGTSIRPFSPHLLPPSFQLTEMNLLEATQWWIARERNIVARTSFQHCNFWRTKGTRISFFCFSRSIILRKTRRTAGRHGSCSVMIIDYHVMIIRTLN